MSETKWTSEQWDAITEKDCNLLVAAAAGAGKTAVLVERIIKKITDDENPVDIDTFLIMTFTNAAAAEMRERIGQAINAVLDKNPESRLIKRQLALLGKASITTIHSFCNQVIRNNFQCIDIDPNFRITDDTESTLMKLEALNEVFEEQYEKEINTEFYELLECYGGNRDDQALLDMVMNLYDFIQSSPFPEEWLDEMTESLNLEQGADFGQTIWGRVLLNSVRMELEGLRDMLRRAVDIVRVGLGLEKYLAVYREDLVNIEYLIELSNSGKGAWNKLFSALRDMEFSTIPRAGKEVDREKQETVKKIRDDVKTRIRKIREKKINADSNEIVNDFNTLYPSMKCLAELVKGMTAKYSEKKSRKSAFDFNDLEHFCLKILSEKGDDGSLKPSPVALSYRERYSEILVDEYQDSNIIQEIMIRMVSKTDTKRPNVFMVGDVKQSIYRFRQARPELFLEKYNTYSTEKGQPYRKILLFKNFRSRKSVVDAVNYVFKQIMSVNVGELDYTDDEALNPGAVFLENNREDVTVGGAAELHLIQTSSKGDSSAIQEVDDSREDSESEQEEEEIPDNIQSEARLVGNRILELMQPDKDGKWFCVYDKSRKSYRKLEFRDIVILLRATKNWSEAFTEELAIMGIPSFADTGSGFFRTVEVQVILSLLQVIDNPLQDIPLLSVLRSPIVLFTTDELAELRLADRKAPLFEALKSLALEGEGQASRKAKSFIDSLKKWRELSLYLSTDLLIWKLYNETGYYSMVGAMPAGEQRQANLRILFERARQYEGTSYKGLFNFIYFIDKLKSSRGDMGSAKILGENDNVVRIMSIHKSKGLEFPVVFLSGCGKKFNLQDMNKSILLNQDLGFGPDVVDHKRRISWPSAAKQAIREKIKAETLSEEIRILYVALTRAREKLIITGAVNNLEKSLIKWLAASSTSENTLPDYEMLKGNSYLDWICPAIVRHKECESLRQSAPIGTELSGSLIEDSSAWYVRLWQNTEVKNGGILESSAEENFLAWLESLEENCDADVEPFQISFEDINTDKAETSALKKEIHRRLSWQYKYAEASTIPAKVSVTELKRRFNSHSEDESAAMPGYLTPLVKKPLFLEEKKGLSAAEKGTVLHFIMQHLELGAIKALFELSQKVKDGLDDEIRKQIDRMVAKDLLTRHQADSADVKKISAFFMSDLGERMLLACNISREIPFNMEIPCCELYKDLDNRLFRDETVILQGVIDCYFEESDGIVLVDYKTDYVPKGAEEDIKERYKIQISYYSRALEMLSEKKVKDSFIYLFWNGETLVM